MSVVIMVYAVLFFSAATCSDIRLTRSINIKKRSLNNL